MAECQVPDALSTRVEDVGSIDAAGSRCAAAIEHHGVALGHGDNSPVAALSPQAGGPPAPVTTPIVISSAAVRPIS